MNQRRAERYPFKLSLEIIDLYKQDSIKIDEVNATIEVADISQFGLGFKTNVKLPIGYYFNASIQVSEGSTLHSVVRIVREGILENDIYFYGCEFVAVADVLSYIFDEIKEKSES